MIDSELKASHQKDSDSRSLAFLCVLALLLLWSVFDYGGRYLHSQAISQSLTALLVVLCGMRIVRQENGRSLLSYPLLRASMVWFLGLALSGLFSVNRLASLEQILRWLGYLSLGGVVYAGIVQAQSRERLLRTTIDLSLICALLVALVSWWMRGDSATLSGTFYRTNDLAGYLLILIPLAMHQFLSAQERLLRLCYGGIFAVLALSLLLTNSRSSWLAGAVGVLWVIWFNRRVFQQRFYQFALGSLAAVAIVGTLLNAPTLIPRLQSLLSFSIFQENSAAWRWELWAAAWRIFSAFPLFGSGPNTYAVVMPAFQLEPGYYSIDPHNFYLQLLAETGLVGACAFAFWCWTVLRRVGRLPNTYSAGVFGGLVASLLHISVDLDWSVSAIPLLLAVLLGAACVPQTDPDEAPLTELQRGRPLAGVLFFLALILAILPAMNYFSARAFNQGRVALQEQDYEKALEHLERARRFAPWPSGSHVATLGQVHFKMQEGPRALYLTHQALELDRYNANYYKQASDILLMLERPEEALQMLKARQSLTPYRHPSLYTDLGDFYAQRGQHKEALYWYDKGAAAFQGKIGRYEVYVPNDRYELFTLYQRRAQLGAALNSPKLTQESEQWAQQTIRQGRRDMYVKTGYAYPMEALLAYWEHLAQGKQGTPDAVHPEAQIQAPPHVEQLDISKLRVLYARRQILSAVIAYAIPARDNPQRQVLIEDHLVGSPEGWTLGARRPIARGNP